jgi:hypothetical protein
MSCVGEDRRTQVVQPQVKAFLYTWGEGRTTAEGEYIPVRVEELNIGYIDGMLYVSTPMRCYLFCFCWHHVVYPSCGRSL